MGYTTDFEGRFLLNKKLDDQTYEFLKKFNQTRRMKRNVSPEYGVEGEFYVDGGGFMGQADENNVIDHNTPPRTQPGLWCQWMPSEDKKGIEWDGGEKFYRYIEWLGYLITKILAPKGYVLNGRVRWQGADPSDTGVIIIKDNKIRTESI